MNADSVAYWITAISTVFLVVAGFKGLNQWKNQIQGQAKLEWARRIVTSAFDFNEKLNDARMYAIQPEEYEDRIRQPNETEGLTRILNDYHAKSKRLDGLGMARNNLQAATWEGKVVFQNDITVWVEPLEQDYRELQFAVKNYYNHRYVILLEIQDPKDNIESLQTDYELVSGNTSDAFSIKVREHVKSLLDATERLAK